MLHSGLSVQVSCMKGNSVGIERYNEVIASPPRRPEREGPGLNQARFDGLTRRGRSDIGAGTAGMLTK